MHINVRHGAQTKEKGYQAQAQPIAGFPPPPPTRNDAERATEWLPPAAYLPQGWRAGGGGAEPTLEWTRWNGAAGTAKPAATTESGDGDSSPGAILKALAEQQAADQVYDSVASLAWALQAQAAERAGRPAFLPWTRVDPEYKPQVSGLLMTEHGPRQVSILLDTGATHCFICQKLAAALALPASGEPGPDAVVTAGHVESQGLGTPVLAHLCIGDTFRESMSMSPMELHVGTELILGWDWISSHKLEHLYPDGRALATSGVAPVPLDLHRRRPRGEDAGLGVLLDHGEFRRMLRQVVPSVAVSGTTATSNSGWSKPLWADHAGLAALEATARQRGRIRRGLGGEPPRFAEGVEVLQDGTELHLASLGPDASLRLDGQDNPAFENLQEHFKDVLDGAPPGLPPDRGMELELETGDQPMPRSRPIKRLSDSELTELRKQLTDLLDRGWIQHSTAGHAAAVVFARKPDGSWRICYDYRGLNAITRPAVEPLPHIDALLDSTRGSCFFTKLDLASAYHQLSVREKDRWKTSFRSQLGQFEWKVVPYGLQGASSLLMRVMNAALTAGAGPEGPRGGDNTHRGRIPGATGPLGRCAVVYMDDILCFSPTLEQHLLDVEEVLATLRRHHLFAKRSKCEFGRQELGFLGHRLSAAGVSVDPRKVQSIREWATPRSCTEVRRFVGLANYYRRFVEGYAELAAPLTALGSPNARFEWTATAQTSFEALKHALSTAPVLRTFDPARRAVLTTDASGIAVAAILTQPDDAGHQHPIAYESRKLTATERAYPAHTLELLAVVHALRVFKHYLLGSNAPRPPGCTSDFDLRTDNQAITWLKTNRHLNKMYVRWLDDIADFSFDVTHVPGARNPSDPLSRRGFVDGDGPATSTGDPDPESQQELFSRLGRDAPDLTDSVNLAVIRAKQARTRREAAAVFATGLSGRGWLSPDQQVPPEHIPVFAAMDGARLVLATGATTAQTPINRPDGHFLAPEFVETWAREIMVDSFFASIMTGAAASLGKLVDRTGTPLQASKKSPKGGAFLIRCGLLYRRGQGEADRLCIPKGGGLRAQVLRECHDGPLSGHFGRSKTSSLVRRLAFWVGQDLDVAEYVRSCQTCQRTKAEHGGPRGLLHPLPLPTRRGGMIGVDWIAGLPTTANGFDMIQNHVDLLSGKVHAVPTRATATAKDAADIIVEMCMRSGDGMPDVIVVDHDPKFTSKLFTAFVKSMGSCLIVGSAYHKNTNAKVERANGVIGDTLRAVANGRKDDWDQHLPFAVFAINNAVSTVDGGLTPFFIDRGAHPRLPLSAPADARQAAESSTDYARRMRQMERTVRELLLAAQLDRKAKLDAGRVDTVFKIGDQVLLRTKELLDAADIGKLKPRWDGPFTVMAVPSPNAYTLALPPRMKCSPTVNVDRLKPFHTRVGASPPPGPVDDPGQEGEHEVEMLLNRKTSPKGVTRYLVRFRGHTSAEDEWIREEELGHCLEKVAEYDVAAPRRRAAQRMEAQGRRALVDSQPPLPAVDGGPALAAQAPHPPPGFRFALSHELRGERALTGTKVLYFWPAHGWLQGRVGKICPRTAFSHVVAYRKSSALGAAVVDTLLDEASHGPRGRWLMLLKE